MAARWLVGNWHQGAVLAVTASVRSLAVNRRATRGFRCVLVAHSRQSAAPFVTY